MESRRAASLGLFLLAVGSLLTSIPACIATEGTPGEATPTQVAVSSSPEATSIPTLPTVIAREGLATPSISITPLPTPTPTVTPTLTPISSPTATAAVPSPTPIPTPTPAPVSPPDSASARHWPVKADLAVGESYTYTLQDGSTRTLTLLRYQVLIPRHKVEATVKVSGSGRADTHTLRVAMDGAPVSINGLRVYAYAWKEADDTGFEMVGEQGGFPLAKDKDIGFALNDARAIMYPDMDAHVYPFENALHEGAYLQTWLEPDLANAHSGYDVGVHAGVRVLAPRNGYVYYTWYSDQGYVTLKPQKGKYSSPGWVFTHIRRGSHLVEEGSFVTKGTPLAEIIPRSPPYHYHLGQTPNDFGSWIWAAEVWNHQHRHDFPAPRYWLALGPYKGDLSASHIYPNESGDIPSILAPMKGAPDRNGVRSWKLADNFVNSVVRVNELLSEAPFSGYSDARVSDSVGYIASYIYSPVDHSTSNAVHLKWGLSYGGTVWLNDKAVYNGVEGRYDTYDIANESPLVIDKHHLLLPLKQGWNTLIIKTNHGRRGGTAWLMSPKIGDVQGQRILDLVFSVRDIQLQASSPGSGRIDLTWTHSDFHGTFVDAYKLDVARDLGFSDLVVADRDVGKVSSHSISGLASGQTYFVRMKPYNRSEMGGMVYWHHMDIASVEVPAG